MDPIWRFLPDHLILRILEFSNEIEQRVAFKILPRKLVLPKNLEFRSEIVYDQESQTLFDFRGMVEEYYIVRKNFPFSQYRSGGNLYVFNMNWEPYQCYLFSSDYFIGPSCYRNHLVISDKRVKFR